MQALVPVAALLLVVGMALQPGHEGGFACLQLISAGADEPTLNLGNAMLCGGDGGHSMMGVDGVGEGAASIVVGVFRRVAYAHLVPDPEAAPTENRVRATVGLARQDTSGKMIPLLTLNKAFCPPTVRSRLSGGPVDQSAYLRGGARSHVSF